MPGFKDTYIVDGAQVLCSATQIPRKKSKLTAMTQMTVQTDGKRVAVNTDKVINSLLFGMCRHLTTMAPPMGIPKPCIYNPVTVTPWTDVDDQQTIQGRARLLGKSKCRCLAPMALNRAIW